jgi:capsular exopolysaccharide synthesis family protein
VSERTLEVSPRRNLIDPGSPSAEPFRALRLALDLRSQSETARIVLFTSAEPSEGKSTIAANYGLVCALSYNKVLLIDADLRRPQLHEYFGLPRGPGLLEALAAGVGPTVHARTLANLTVLTSGQPVSRTGDLPASPRMGSLLRHAASEYGLVVVDSPPVLSAPDAAGISVHPGVEVVLVVGRTTKRRMVNRALRQLRLVNAQIAGVVVNREGQLDTYGYGYGYE